MRVVDKDLEAMVGQMLLPAKEESLSSLTLLQPLLEEMLSTKSAT